ncbi:MAG: Hfq-like protein [Thermoanaerobaculia bacterium]
MSFAGRHNGSAGTRRRVSGQTFPDIRDHRRPNANGRAKTSPPEQTNAEAFYYLKQMNARTPMVVVTTDGEEIRGWIEWYDRTCLKINRTGAPNILIQKHCIKYVFKEENDAARE